MPLATPTRWSRDRCVLDALVAAAAAVPPPRHTHSEAMSCARKSSRCTSKWEEPDGKRELRVPVHNGAACVRDALESILAQADGRPMEIIVVDDASQDDSSAVLQRLAAIWPLRILAGEGRGAAAASNTGVRAARFPIICQVDQDVVLRPGWMQHRRRSSRIRSPAPQGYYAAIPPRHCARARWG